MVAFDQKYKADVLTLDTESLQWKDSSKGSEISFKQTNCQAALWQAQMTDDSFTIRNLEFQRLTPTILQVSLMPGLAYKAPTVAKKVKKGCVLPERSLAFRCKDEEEANSLETTLRNALEKNQERTFFIFNIFVFCGILRARTFGKKSKIEKLAFKSKRLNRGSTRNTPNSPEEARLIVDASLRQRAASAIQR